CDSHSAPFGWRSTFFPGGIFPTHRTPQQWYVVIAGEERHQTPSQEGAWYGARSTDYRSVPGPTSAHCEGLCGQDWFGRGDQSVSPDGDGDRSGDHCAWYDSRYLEWTESSVSLGRVLYASRYGPAVGQSRPARGLSGRYRRTGLGAPVCHRHHEGVYGLCRTGRSRLWLRQTLCAF